MATWLDTHARENEARLIVFLKRKLPEPPFFSDDA